MAVENRRQKSVYGRQGRREQAGIERLGDLVEQVIERGVVPRQVWFGRLTEVWGGLLPAELRRHCRIADVSGGLVRVLADSPSYVYELMLCREELLEGMKQRCPRLGIKNIKVTVG